jgi:hypothetical protein
VRHPGILFACMKVPNLVFHYLSAARPGEAGFVRLGPLP